MFISENEADWVSKKVFTANSQFKIPSFDEIIFIGFERARRSAAHGEPKGQGSGGNILNDAANSLGIGMGVQQEALGYAVAQNYKSARNPWAFAGLRRTQQAWRTTNTLGKIGKGILTATKVLGVTAGAIQIGVKGAEIFNKGYQNATLRDWTDIGVNSAGVVAAVFFASNPIGWAVGAAALAYSIGTTIYDVSTKP